MKFKSMPERLVVGENSENSPHYLRHKTAYAFAKKFIENSFVLDNGCGTGYGSYYLITNGARKVVGVDISRDAVEYAKKRYKFNNLYYEVRDATKLNFENNTFDVLTSFQVIEHIADVDAYLTEIKKVLKKIGRAHV